MAIFKILPTWLKAVDKRQLTDAFSDAWGNMVNALSGSWGPVEYLITTNGTEKVTASFIKGDYVAKWEKNITDSFPVSTQINLPIESLGSTLVIIRNVSGNQVMTSTEYIIPEGSLSITVDLSPGLNIISLYGTARRI